MGEPWVLRFEDIDGPRVAAGAREAQLEDLRALGLEADAVVVQSALRARHWGLFRRAVGEGRVYPCFCSRKEVREALECAASAPHRAVPIYSGKCRALRGRCAPTGHGLPSLGWRFAVEGEIDGNRGVVEASGARDFIVARSGADLDAQGLPEESGFVPAYHWACAIDDFDGDYKLLVRAIDLADAVDQQRAIMAWCAGIEGRPPRFPAVFHAALVTGEGGARLEKRTRGVTLPELVARGIDGRRLAERFAEGFRADAAEFGSGKVWSEARAEWTLSELGV